MKNGHVVQRTKNLQMQYESKCVSTPMLTLRRTNMEIGDFSIQKVIRGIKKEPHVSQHAMELVEFNNFSSFFEKTLVLQAGSLIMKRERCVDQNRPSVVHAQHSLC